MKNVKNNPPKDRFKRNQAMLNDTIIQSSSMSSIHTSLLLLLLSSLLEVFQPFLETSIRAYTYIQPTHIQPERQEPPYHSPGLAFFIKLSWESLTSSARIDHTTFSYAISLEMTL